MRRSKKPAVNIKAMRQCRIAKGISINELAERVGVSPEFILKVESNGSTNAMMAEDFARVLEVKLINLFLPYNEDRGDLHFVWNLKMEREAKGMSISELAMKCKIPMVDLLKIEKINKKASWYQISKICVGLNIAENQLLISKDALERKVLDKQTFVYKADDFKGIRMAMGIEQDELAKDMKIPVSRLQELEDGTTRVTKDMLQRFFMWLNFYRNKVGIVVQKDK